MKIQFLLLAGAIFFVSACAAPTPAPPSLAGTNWKLQSIMQNGAIQTPAAGTKVTLDFGNDGRVSGDSGCNHYGGTYETQGEILTIRELVQTLRACADQNGMNFEGAYLAGLQNAQIYERSGSQLTITFANGNGKLLFTAR